MMPLKYSLVVATLHDEGELAFLLASLVEQINSPPFEIIIVDQNGDDRLVELVARYSHELKIIHERVPFRSATRARNVGARLAVGEWVGFPDDDCQLRPNALYEVEMVSKDQRVQVITGQTIDENGMPNVLRWKQTSVTFNQQSMFSCLTEATMFVQRELFLQADGFDERFGPGATYPAAEGIDLMNRLFPLMKDGKACYSPAIKMQHPSKIPPWTLWAVRRFHSYAIGDGAVIAKNPQPHMLNWGLRTLISATIQIFSLDGLRGLAFAARLCGLLKGFILFHVASWKK